MHFLKKDKTAERGAAAASPAGAARREPSTVVSTVYEPSPELNVIKVEVWVTTTLDGRAGALGGSTRGEIKA